MYPLYIAAGVDVLDIAPNEAIAIAAVVCVTIVIVIAMVMVMVFAKILT